MLEILAIHNHLLSEPARPHQYLFDCRWHATQTIIDIIDIATKVEYLI
jgi:hypothetical protein